MDASSPGTALTPDSPALVSVAGLTACTRHVIRKAAPQHRPAMWSAWTTEIAKAQQASPSRMPWEAPDAVTEITAEAAKPAIAALLYSIPDKTEAKRLRTILARELEQMVQAPDSTAGTGKPSKYPPRQCARPGCPVVFTPRHPSATYHNAACRSAVHKARKQAQKGARTANSPQPGNGTQSIPRTLQRALGAPVPKRAKMQMSLPLWSRITLIRSPPGNCRSPWRPRARDQEASPALPASCLSRVSICAARSTASSLSVARA